MQKKKVWVMKQRMQEWLDGGNLKIVTHKDAKGKLVEYLEKSIVLIQT